MAHTVPSQVAIDSGADLPTRKPEKGQTEDVDIETLETVRYRPLKQGRPVVAPRLQIVLASALRRVRARRPGSMLSEPRIHPATRRDQRYRERARPRDHLVARSVSLSEREFQLTDDRRGSFT